VTLLPLPTLSTRTVDLLLNNCVIAERTRWSVLKASGPALRDYLQGQITQNMDRLTNTAAIHGAILTPQGKAISELYLLEGCHDELLLLTPVDTANATVARLRQFALGHTLRTGIVESMSVYSVQGTHASSILQRLELAEPGVDWLSCSHHADADLHAMVMPQSPHGYWIIVPQTCMQQFSGQLHRVDENEVEAMRIIRGLPCFGMEWDASIHPLNANLIEFDGVSFEKGCYVGQEVTSRLHWRGGIKKKLYRVAIDGHPDLLPCPISTSVAIGVLKSAAIDHEGNCVGIAWLPIETAESAAPLSLDNGVMLKVLEVCHA